MAYNEIVLFLQGIVIALWAMLEVRIIVIHTLVNFVVAVSVAVAQGRFEAQKVIDVFLRKLLPLVMVYSVFKFAGAALVGASPDAGFSQFVQLLGTIGPYFVLSAIELLLITDLLDNLAKIPGLDNIMDMVPANLLNIFLKKDTVVERRLRAGHIPMPTDK